MGKIIAIVIALIFSFIGLIGDSALKIAGKGPGFVNWKWFILGFTVYASTAFGWFYAMKHVKLMSLGVFYATFTLIFSVLVGIFYFKESCNGYEIAGIFFALLSLFLLGKFA